MSIGQRIGIRLSEVNKSQQELAEALALSRAAISLYCSDSRKPNFSTIVKIAEFLDTNVGWLIGEKPHGVDERTRELLELWERLSAPRKKLAIDILSVMKDRK